MHLLWCAFTVRFPNQREERMRRNGDDRNAGRLQLAPDPSHSNSNSNCHALSLRFLHSGGRSGGGCHALASALRSACRCLLHLVRAEEALAGQQHSGTRVLHSGAHPPFPLTLSCLHCFVVRVSFGSIKSTDRGVAERSDSSSRHIPPLLLSLVA